MSEEHLLVEASDGIATLTFNRPAALNALSSPMLEGLIESTARFERDDSIRCVVLRGAGDGFMAAGQPRLSYRPPADGTSPPPALTRAGADGKRTTTPPPPTTSRGRPSPAQRATRSAA